jgi:hypothetical protein
MVVTVDTNVIFSALYSIRGAVRDFKNAEMTGFGFGVITPGEFYKLLELRNE